MGTVDEFNIDARKAVVRVGRWVLMALYKHPARIVEGHFVVKIGELRASLELTDEEHRRWVRARITSWTWVLRWIEGLVDMPWDDVRTMALEADRVIRETSPPGLVHDRARQETYVGWKKVIAERRTSKPGPKKKRKKKTA